ncbi:MAG: HAD family hydrolase [Dehalococcoidia bacterium]|nr:HAD family hydrolase [Dehalococcoidia bacterium]MCB9484746.1 HAD family hydrolase [Thermoflexaceae bacterium]
MPHAVFLDMDDTLLDSSGGAEESWKLACSTFAPHLGIEPEQLRLAIRKAAQEFWRDEAVSGHWRVKLKESRVMFVENALREEKLNVDLAKPLATLYDEQVTARYRLFDDAIETLEWLRSTGKRLGLLTNGPQDMQREKIARFELEQYFDFIVIEGEFGRGKPERAVFEHALSRTALMAADAWHVGDNLYADIGGAQSVGIHAVWIHRDRLEMKNDGHAVPDRVIGHLAELRDALSE